MELSANSAGPRAALHEQFGFPEFRPGQEAALRHVLAGRDTLVVMPTGSGKSLIYQLAALLLPGTTLVISPLVALMKDQMDGMRRRGIAAAFVNSSLTTAEQQQRLRALAAGETKILLVAPERLRSQDFRHALKSASLSLLVIDEAHCLSQWGHDFRPDYLHIAELRREFRAPITLALTATATPRVQDDIVRLLGLEQAERLVTGFNRPNLTFEVLPAPDARAKQRLLREILAEADGAGIVYVGTRREAEEVAQFAREACGVEARHYHGALDSATRTQTQDAFMAGDVPLVVATNAFGMGIDRPDVRFVLHYSLPGSLEAYYQEAGRAGRDGLPARAILLYSARDTGLHEFFMENDSPTAAELRQVHAYLMDLPAVDFDGDAAEVRVTPEELESATGLARTRLRVALEQLQAAGAVQRAAGEARGVLWLTVWPLDDARLNAAAQALAARQQLKRDQLDKMVAYAETSACRRRTLLTHFGDHSAPEAEVCCDNCLARLAPAAEMRPAETRSERAALIVLDAIARLNWEIGKGKLVQMLKGSTAQDMAPYRSAPYYGKFSALPTGEVEGLVDQLIQGGYVRQTGSRMPTLKLSASGESTLQAKAAIQVDLRAARQSREGRERRERASGPAGSTVLQTGQMLAQGLRPEEIAATRALTVSTVYSHLAQLIASGEVAVGAVVPAEIEQQVRAALEAVGSSDYLSPLKARLPGEIDYNVIRCVVNAYRRERGQAPAESERAAAPRRALQGEADEALFERLRAWRAETARAASVPAYVVFSDAALTEIAAARPRSGDELLALRGIGPAKLERYGAAVLALVAAAA